MCNGVYNNNIKYDRNCFQKTAPIKLRYCSRTTCHCVRQHSDGSRKDTVQWKFVGGFTRLLKRGNGESTFYFCNCNVFIPREKRKRILDLVDFGNFQVTPIRGVRFCVWFNLFRAHTFPIVDLTLDNTGENQPWVLTVMYLQRIFMTIGFGISQMNVRPYKKLTVILLHAYRNKNPTKMFLYSVFIWKSNFSFKVYYM